MTRRPAATLIALLVITAACRSEPGSPPGQDAAARTLTNVSVETVVPREAVEMIVLPGTVIPDQEFLVSAEVGGLAERIPFDKGDLVKKGDVLVEINRRSSKAAVDGAEAALKAAALAGDEARIAVRGAANMVETSARQLEQARLALKGAEAVREKAKLALDNGRRQFERLRALWEDKLVSQAAYDDAQTQIKALEADHEAARSALETARESISIAEGAQTSARLQEESARLGVETAGARIASQEAALTQARLHWEKGLITAPFDGWVEEVYFETGEFVKAESAILRIIRMDPVKVRVSLPEKDIPFIRPGQTAAVTIASLPGEELAGRVSFVALSTDQRTNTYTVEIEVPNPRGKVRAGMVAQVALVRRRVPDALGAPAFAVVSKEDGDVVFVLEGGRAVLRKVATGIRDNGRVQILSGLAAGDKLIVKGQRDLEDGEEVKVY